MFKSNKILLSVASLLAAVSASANDHTSTLTARVSTAYDQEAKMKVGSVQISGTARFTVAADANTTVTVKDMVIDSNNGFSFKFSIKVNCTGFDMKVKAFGTHSIPVTETVCISSTEERTITMELPQDETKRVEAVQAQVYLALMNENGTSPEGFNLDTQFANTVEKICCGAKDALKNAVSCMAFKNRKAQMAELIAGLVVSVVGAAH